MAILVARTNLPVWDFQKLASLVYNARREKTSIKLFFVDEKEVQRATVDIKAVEDTIQTVTGTLL